MTEKKDAECIEIHVTELCGVQVLRKYVKTVRQNEEILSDKNASRRVRILLGAMPVLMFLSTIICLGVMVGVLYNPPPLVKELSESILINFGKSNTLALEEQLKNANDRIWDLQREIEKLKGEGLVNFTREQQIFASLSVAKEENVALSKNVHRISELEQNLEICMKEKIAFQKSDLDSQKRENEANQDLAKCNANKKKLNGKIGELQEKESVLTKSLKAADDFSKELEKNLNKTQEDLNSVLTEKKTIDKKLEKTSKTLSDCQHENTQCQKNNEDLSSRLSTCETKNEDLEKDKDTLSKDLDATKYTLGNCKNKNMDHEVRSLELLQEIEGLKKELKAC